MITTLIGFTGRQYVGKSTMAHNFAKQSTFSVYAYADPLKESLSVLTGLPLKHFTDPILKRGLVPGTNVTCRELMQKYATDFVREMIHPDYWVIRMKERLPYAGKYVIIDDIRFDNEAQFILDNGGIIIKLTRNDSPRTDTHKSENGISEELIDLCIEIPEGEIQAYNYVSSELRSLGVLIP